jgi:uncharacterized membrane protein YphA (DoxX/SURF4 family)
MDTAITALQVIAALGIYNVWLLRAGKATNWRGGDSTTMVEEFAVYGLPPIAVRVVGSLKLLFATLLLVGLWVPVVTRPAALGLAALMLGAVAMHVKVKDPLEKSLPAATMLVLCLIVGLV